MGAIGKGASRAAKIGGAVVGVIGQAAVLEPSDAAREIEKVLGSTDPESDGLSLPNPSAYVVSKIRDADFTVLVIVSRDPERPKKPKEPKPAEPAEPAAGE